MLIFKKIGSPKMNVFKRYPIQRKPEKRYDANSLSKRYEKLRKLIINAPKMLSSWLLIIKF